MSEAEIQDFLDRPILKCKDIGNMKIHLINEPTIADLKKVIDYVNRNLADKAFPKIATNELLSQEYSKLWYQKYKLNEQLYSIAIYEDEIVGVSHINLFHGHRKHGGKLAITVDNKHRGRGIGNLLLKNIILQCKIKGVFLIRAEPTEDNYAMIHLLEKNDFYVEGRCKKAFLDDSGDYLDLIEFTLFIRNEK